MVRGYSRFVRWQCRPRQTSARIGMRAQRTIISILPFVATTAALQLALSPCRAPALRAGAPCMKYSAINDLSLLITDAEVRVGAP
jgi:hypothetical protein